MSNGTGDRSKGPGRGKVRGRPFGAGHDERRNVAGRKSIKKAATPRQIVIAALMKEQTVIERGVKRKRPRIDIVLDQLLGQIMQRDLAAARTFATVVRAVNSLTTEELDGLASGAPPDLGRLNRLMDDFVRRAEVAEASSRDSPDDLFSKPKGKTNDRRRP